MRSFFLLAGVIPALAAELVPSPNGSCGSVSKMAFVKGGINLLMIFDRAPASPVSDHSTVDAVRRMASAALPLPTAVPAASQTTAGAAASTI